MTTHAHKKNKKERDSILFAISDNKPLHSHGAQDIKDVTLMTSTGFEGVSSVPPFPAKQQFAGGGTGTADAR